jgi:serine/threonine protein phosphatase PrpC
MKFSYGIGTDVGRKRSQNQDSSAAHPELGLFVVSDGMGGHKGGETASALAIETITDEVRQSLNSKSMNSPNEVITKAIERASQSIHQTAEKKPDLKGMGTTTTALFFSKNGSSPPLLTIGHVGDSRCYFLKPKALWQATRDHSLVQEKLRAGLITRAQVKTDKMKNVITRSVGYEAKVEVETYQKTLEKGDCFLVCSDGLSGLLEDPEMLKIIDRDFFQGRNPQKAVQELIAAANSNGGDDNITALLVQVEL